MRFIKNERGLTLVEVVASIVILTLVLTSFLGLLLSVTKSAQQAREVIDYTFIAQQNMESIYEKSTSFSLSDLKTIMTEELTFQESVRDPNVFTKKEKDANDEIYEVKVSFSDYVPQKTVFDNLSTSLNRVVIEVTPQETSRPYAKIENLLEWDGQ